MRITKENNMTNLIVIGFDDEQTAFQMRAELMTLQQDYLIDMERCTVERGGNSVGSMRH